MKRSTLIILAIFSISFASHALATTYYVSTSGNDSNPGTFSSPWRTIQKAANTMVAGDTVIVNAGTYNERASETTSGSSGNLITYATNGTVFCQGFSITGNYVKIDGFNIENVGCTWEGGIYISSDYVAVENCTVTEAGYRGMLLSGTADYCTVRDCTFIRCGHHGIDVGGSSHLIENNEVYDTRCKIGSCSSGDADGMHFFGTGHTFRGNYIHGISFENNPGYSPHIDAWQTWTYTDSGGVGKNCVFEKNFVYLPADPYDSSKSVCGWMLGGAQNITIKNNIVHAHRGIHLYVNEGGDDPGELHVYNNTFLGNLDWSLVKYPTAIWPKDSGGPIMIKNNIIVDYPWSHISFSNLSGIVEVDYNCKYNSDGSTPGGQGEQPHDVWKKDPKFVSYNWSGGGGDYHLQPDSPCIDAGATVSGVANDYDGTSRPQGEEFDIGAYEFHESESTSPSPPTGLKIM